MSRLVMHNNATGEIAPPHKLGQAADGKTIYQAVTGWELVSYSGDGNECGDDFDRVDHELDQDGNYIVG